MALTTCVILCKNGKEQYIPISDKYQAYDWQENNGFFFLYGKNYKSLNSKEPSKKGWQYTLLIKIRLSSMNGFYFEND